MYALMSFWLTSMFTTIVYHYFQIRVSAESPSWFSGGDKFLFFDLLTWQQMTTVIMAILFLTEFVLISFFLVSVAWIIFHAIFSFWHFLSNPCSPWVSWSLSSHGVGCVVGSVGPKYNTWHTDIRLKMQLYCWKKQLTGKGAWIWIT